MAALLFVWVWGVTGCAWRVAEAPEPEIYDPRADGELVLGEALVRSRDEGKRVLLSLGANWCGDSQKMFRLLRENEAISDVLGRNYVLAMVDVNRKGGAPRNEALLTRLGESVEGGIPILLVLDPNGTVLNWDRTRRLRDSDHEHPDKVLSFLREWAVAP